MSFFSDAVDTLPFGVKKTTTKLPVTVGLNDREQQDEEVDCRWTDFGQWSPCSNSCNTGTQSRRRLVAEIARNGGRRCIGSPVETRTCNNQRCPETTTTTTSTTTTTTPRQTRPEPRRDRVKCFACGSLFTTDAPQCGNFNVSDAAQQKTCEFGEACLWYAYYKSANERAVVRECFSTSILLGSINEPIETLSECVPQTIDEGEDAILACICTSDFCNGIGTNDIPQFQNQQQRPVTQPLSRRTTTERPTRRTEAPRRRTTQEPRTTNAPSRRRPVQQQQRRPATTEVVRSDPNRGNLFFCRFCCYFRSRCNN
jgi:hypothetical protein